MSGPPLAPPTICAEWKTSARVVSVMAPPDACGWISLSRAASSRAAAFIAVVMISAATLTSLDFLGFGLPLGSPSLGELLLQGKNNLQAPWLGLAGFFTLAILLSLLIFIGEAVRDAFDPGKGA